MLRSLIALLLLAVATVSADARPRHSQSAVTQFCGDRICSQQQSEVKRTTRQARYAVRTSKRIARATIEAPAAAYAGTTELVSRARQYLGTNPTGRSSLWCGAFMAKVAPAAAARVSNPNMARAYLELPRVAPQVGAIVVFRRGNSGKSGHVGVVTGFDSAGNPIVVSGNTWNRSTGGRRTVAEGVYDRHKVIAYVTGG